MSARKRVLFVAEDVTLAQVTRLFVLARSLDPDRYEVHFACARFDPLIFADSTFARHLLYTLDRERVLRAAQGGRQLYDERVLARYIADELALFRDVRPDVVIGDLRFSLCISAPHAGIPHAALINATWNRHAERSAFPVPDHPIVRVLGEALAARSFPYALPRVLARIAAPINRLRERYRLPPIGDLLDVITFADLVLYPDVPWLVPLRRQPAHHVFLGPVLWSPSTPPPPWWEQTAHLPRSIYVTLGSSGAIGRLPRVLRGLSALERPLLVATAGRQRSTLQAEHVWTADYLPGSDAARRAELVVCNGGSATAYQALAEGRPVLGIASNLDQFLTMTALSDRGLGVLLRASTLTPARVQRAAEQLIEDASYRRAALRARAELTAYDARTRFQTALNALC